MLALSIVLLVLVLFLLVVSFVGSSQEIIIEFANVTITTSVGGVFVAGVVAGLVALVSLVALRISLRGVWNRRKEVRELRRQAGVSAEPGPAGRPEVEPRRTDTGSEQTSHRTEGTAAAEPTRETGPAPLDEPEAGKDSDMDSGKDEGQHRDEPRS